MNEPLAIEEQEAERVRLDTTGLLADRWTSIAIQDEQTGDPAVLVRFEGRWNKTSKRGSANVLMSPEDAKRFRAGIGRTIDIALTAEARVRRRRGR